MKKAFALVAVMVAILVVGAACVGVAQEDYDAVVAEMDSAQAELQSVNTELQSVNAELRSVQNELSAVTKLTLPEEAIKLSDVVPAMGEHWGNLAQLPLGPLYLVYKGEVIGIEYMYTEDMMQEVSIPTPEGPEVFQDLGHLPVGVSVDHVNVSFMPHGHEGFEVPHWDIHLYFITQEERAAVMPGD